MFIPLNVLFKLGVSLPKLVILFENSGKVIQHIEDFDTLSGCSDTGFVSESR